MVIIPRIILRPMVSHEGPKPELLLKRKILTKMRTTANVIIALLDQHQSLFLFLPHIYIIQSYRFSFHSWE